MTPNRTPRLWHLGLVLTATISLSLAACDTSPWTGDQHVGRAPCAAQLGWHIGPDTQPSYPSWIRAYSATDCAPAQLRIRWTNGTLTGHPAPTSGVIVNHKRRDITAFSLTNPTTGGCVTHHVTIDSRTETTWTGSC